MGKWPLVRLGDVATVVSGSTPKTSVEEYWNGNNCWVTPAELSDEVFVINDTNRKITDLAVKDTGLKPLPKGTVLLSSRAPIGKVAITGHVMYCNQGFKNLICGESIYNKYLFWFLKGKTEYLNSLGRGATFKEISKKIVEDIKIPLPCIDIQKHIANTLDKTQEIIDGHKKQLAELDDLIKAVFYEMFGDIRLNKKKWARTKIGEVCHDNIKKLSGNEKIEISYVDISAISNTEKEIISVKNINSKDAPSRAKQILELNDILVSTVRPNLNAVAINNINTGKKVIGSTGFCVLRCKSTINYRYLFEIVKSDYFIDKLVSLARGASYPAVTDYDVKNIDIPIPPLDLQNKFAEIVAKIEEEKALVKQAITESEHLFNSLMNEYFD